MAFSWDSGTLLVVLACFFASLAGEHFCSFLKGYMPALTSALFSLECACISTRRFDAVVDIDALLFDKFT